MFHRSGSKRGALFYGEYANRMPARGGREGGGRAAPQAPLPNLGAT